MGRVSGTGCVAVVRISVNLEYLIFFTDYDV